MNRQFWREFWQLLSPYWRSEERWVAWGLLVTVIALNLGLVYLIVQLNFWNARFFNALEAKDFDAYLHEMLVFCVLAVIWILVAVYALYLNQALQIRWRRWLTDRFLDDWLADRIYYRQQLGEGATDNPDQRISEDIRNFVRDTLGLGLSLMRNIITLITFLGILWVLSGPLSFALFGFQIDIPGYMFWVALIYSVGGTWVTHLIGRPLIRLNFDQQRREADFRFGLVRFRENAEPIALYRGEAGEKRGLTQMFDEIRANWYAIMTRQKKLTFFTAGFGQIADVFPLFVAAPMYFSGAIPLGGLTQTASAFGRVQGSLSWFIDFYVALTEWKATIDRLIGFRHAVEIARQGAAATAIDVATEPRGDLAVERVRLALPDDTTLIEGGGLSIRPNDRLLITGPSGSGKSTLFRALAGIWPFGEAHIRVPSEAHVLFLPQRPYLPLGTLRSVIAYPAQPEEVPAEAIVTALRTVGLEGVADELDRIDQWGKRLSPGEQQRLAIARALLLKPDWLFLDEATAALDEDSERRIYETLLERLPDTTLVSISHRPSVAQFHDRQWRIEPTAGGPGRVVEVATGGGGLAVPLPA